MAKHRKLRQDEVKMDMTPMIDCVFQLIIFFFLIIDLQNQDLEDLVLPRSDKAVPDEAPEGVRPIINVHQTGRMVYKMKDYYTPDRAKDFQKLDSLLYGFAHTIMTRKMDPDIKKVIPYDPLLIRADEFTEMHYIAKIMERCGDQKVMIWKIELALGERKDGKTAADFIPSQK